jgi:hypothetical protein
MPQPARIHQRFKCNRIGSEECGGDGGACGIGLTCPVSSKQNVEISSDLYGNLVVCHVVQKSWYHCDPVAMAWDICRVMKGADIKCL